MSFRSFGRFEECFECFGLSAGEDVVHGLEHERVSFRSDRTSKRFEVGFVVAQARHALLEADDAILEAATRECHTVRQRQLTARHQVRHERLGGTPTSGGVYALTHCEGWCGRLGCEHQSQLLVHCSGGLDLRQDTLVEVEDRARALQGHLPHGCLSGLIRCAGATDVDRQAALLLHRLDDARAQFAGKSIDAAWE
jgi:hypothetical protein